MPSRSCPGPHPAALLLLAATLTGCASDPLLVDESPGGFALYRSGRLSGAEIGELCAAGVEEIAVLAGTGRERECVLRREHCPGLRVVYDEEQQADSPLSAAFLEAFDDWVGEARAEGRKIAFRCRHGWHRAGRLTAWYRMRWQGWSAERASAEMLERGRLMFRHPTLVPQVRALADHLAGRACSTEPQHCVVVEPRASEGASDAASPSFVPDVCAQAPEPRTSSHRSRTTSRPRCST